MKHNKQFNKESFDEFMENALNDYKNKMDLETQGQSDEEWLDDLVIETQHDYSNSIIGKTEYLKWERLISMSRKGLEADSYKEALDDIDGLVKLEGISELGSYVHGIVMRATKETQRQADEK